MEKFNIDNLLNKASTNTEIELILKNVVKASDTIVREIMIPRTEVVAVPHNVSFSQLIETFAKYKFSRIPVFEENIDNITGIIYSKDLISYKLDQEKFNINQISKQPLFVPETQKILSLLKEFKNKKIHIAIVIDEFGGVSGLVTLIDIVEEIIGDFKDEFEEDEKPLITEINKCQYLIDSICPLEDIEEVTGINLPEGAYDTIGGYVIKELGRMPEKDEKLIKDNYEIVVNEVYEKGIKNLILTVKERCPSQVEGA